MQAVVSTTNAAAAISTAAPLRAGRRADVAPVAPRRAGVIAAAGSSQDADRVALSRRKTIAGLVAIPAVFAARQARADDEVVEASVETPAEEPAAPVEAAIEAPVEEEAAPAPVEPPTPQGNDDPLAAYNAATSTGGNSKTAKAVVSASKKESGGGGGAIAGVVGALGLGAAGFAAFKAGAGAGDDDDEEDASASYYEEVEEASPAPVEEEETEEYYEEEVEEKPQNDFAAKAAAAASAAAAAAAAKREEAAEAARERQEAAATARAERAASSAATKIMTRPSSGTQITQADREIPAFSTRTVRMPASSGGGDPDSLLPRGFPTVEDLAECETPEEKEELCDKADLLVERLEAKADSAEAFVDGPVCSFLSFLKPNAIRNAEKARATAEEAAAAAAALRRAAKGGAGGAAVAAGVAALVAAGAAAVVLGSSGDAPIITKSSAPKAPRAEAVKKAPKERAASSASLPMFTAPDTKADKGPYGVEAADLVSKVKSGEGDALSAYEALQRKGN